MAGDPLVAATTLTIPHPYPENGAEEWIGNHADWRETGSCYAFALEEKNTSKLLGCVSIDITAQHRRGVLGYWIGKEYWNHKYCTEATKRVIAFGFQDLNLERISAYHLAENPASGKVMKNSGMQQEGYFRKHVFKSGVFKDCVFFGITKDQTSI
jgi:ribosomal-protein-alanine N-acetyltransferase